MLDNLLHLPCHTEDIGHPVAVKLLGFDDVAQV